MVSLARLFVVALRMAVKRKAAKAKSVVSRGCKPSSRISLKRPPRTPRLSQEIAVTPVVVVPASAPSVTPVVCHDESKKNGSSRQ